MQAADAIAEMRWPTLDPDDLQGSAVGRIAAPDLVAARLTDVVANMRGWAVAAHMSADALERADRRNGERFGHGDAADRLASRSVAAGFTAAAGRRLG